MMQEQQHLTTNNSVLNTHYVSQSEYGQAFGTNRHYLFPGHLSCTRLLTGRVPFAGDDAISIAGKQSAKPSATIADQLTLTTAPEAIILRYSRKPSYLRYQTLTRLARRCLIHCWSRHCSYHREAPHCDATSANFQVGSSRHRRPTPTGHARWQHLVAQTVHSREEADELDKRENKRHKRNVILGVLGAGCHSLCRLCCAQMLKAALPSGIWFPQFI